MAARDPILGGMIEQIGPVRRVCIPDLFTALMHTIAGQQISGKAHQSVWKRVLVVCGTPLTPERVATLPDETLRSAGLSGRKVAYIKEAARQMSCGELEPKALADLDDEAFISALCVLPGVGRWTAEMLLIFSLAREDVLSTGDFGIRRGLRMVYQKAELTAADLANYRALYSPYASVASLYLWEIAGGTLNLADPLADSGLRSKKKKNAQQKEP
ncbi:MAG: DNA-3-methyladenine glycosylase 2 family protein [Desulfovibrionaceae bacterium]|nr:DNA-3-methyladenine glycosylase 2 family protein [Desulfovibrionaceae bacterium]